MERLFHQIFAFLDVIENFASETKNLPINQVAGAGDVRDFSHNAVSL